MYIDSMGAPNFTILEKLEHLARTAPDKAAVFYEPGESLSHSELWALSGKIYAYLKQKGIGAEDVIMYCLPRGLNLFASIIGTMRAGAAFVLTETDNSVQRTAFIKKDCECRLFVDEQLFQEILETEPAEGFVPENMHSLCYIAYTSGTTGSPKGVLHEYGSLENACKAARHKDEPLFEPQNIFLLMSPMNFVSFPIAFALSVAYEFTIAVMPYHYAESEDNLLDYIEQNHVDCGYITPSFVRKHSTLKLPWKKCILSSESADGIFLEGVGNYNCYASTEAGCLLTVYKLPHAMTPAPVGYPKSDIDLSVIKEDGTKALENEEGEICFASPYIRGYLHLPGETKRLMDGGVIHTGNAGKMTKDGLVICGRMTEMFKVQGFRIEPEEVEKAVAEVCGIDSPVVRGFVHKDISSIVVFYTGSADIDVIAAREKLQKRLPEYMVPTNFIRVDHFPLLETGKLDRHHLLPKEGDWNEILKDCLDKDRMAKFPVVGKGRTSTVLQISKDKVIKLFHASIPFATIQGEYERTRFVHSAKIPAPDAYDVVLSRKRYGIILDYVQGENLEQAILEHPNRRSELLKKFVEAVKEIHQIKICDSSIPDIKKSAISFAKNLDRQKFSDSDVEKIINIFRCIPDSKGFVHGDCHTANAMVVGNKISFIDFSLCGKGHPVFDLVCMYSHYVFLPSFEEDQSYRERTGFSKKDAEWIFEEFFRYYYNTDDAQFLEETKKLLLGILAARLCLASIIIPDSFSEWILQSVKKIAVDFSDKFCRPGSINNICELC